MHSRRLVAALIGLVLAACPVLAMAGFVASNNPVEGRFEVVYASGVTIAFDAYSQVASVSAPNGQAAHFTFGQLAAQQFGTEHERQVYVQRLVASILSPNNWSALTDSIEPTLNLPGGGGGGGGGSTIPNGGSNLKDGSREEQSLAGSGGSASIQDFGLPSNCGPFSIGCDCAFGMSCSPIMGQICGSSIYGIVILQGVKSARQVRCAWQWIVTIGRSITPLPAGRGPT